MSYINQFNTPATWITGGVLAFGVATLGAVKSIDNLKQHSLKTQENGFHTVMPEQFQGRIKNDVDCAKTADGIYVAYSGGQPIPNTTAVFNENRLPMAVPSVTGACDVTVTNDNGDVIDEYKVNAYPLELVVYNL